MLVRKLQSRGDTIVEVLVAIAVVSFVLAVAYVTANKNTLRNQDIQEHSQALQLATSQLEFLHTNSIGTNNCFDTGGNPVGTAGSNGPCMVKGDGTQNTTHTPPEYTIAITKPTAITYQVNVSWDSTLNSGGKNSVTLYYQP